MLNVELGVVSGLDLVKQQVEDTRVKNPVLVDFIRLDLKVGKCLYIVACQSGGLFL
jgi:hypothetical protein